MPIKIHDLKYTIEVCDWVQEPKGIDELTNSRVPLFETKAKIEQVDKYRLKSFRAHFEDRNKVNHVFTIRERCDFEPSPKMWVYRNSRGKDYWYKVLYSDDYEEGYNYYHRFFCVLWSRDSVKLDTEIQDVPCEDLVPDMNVEQSFHSKPKFDYRDFGI